MTETEAILALVKLAKKRIETIDGEWGCVHSYEVALANRTNREPWDGDDDDLSINCYMHDEAVELHQVIEALPAEVRAALQADDGGA